MYRSEAISMSTLAEGWDEGNGVARFALRNWFWIVASVFVAVLGILNLIRANATAVDRELRGTPLQGDSVLDYRGPQPVQDTGTPHRSITSDVSKTIPTVRPGRVPIPEHKLPPMAALPIPHSGPPSQENPPVVSAASAPPVEVAKLAFPSNPPLRGERSFAGTWLYSPRPGDTVEPGQYPATYVELVLVEHDGELAGDYRARYKIPDQAVSPEVTFQIRGAARSTRSAKFSWSSDDNAKGLAEMTLRSPNVLYVSWWTTGFGRRAALGSGTAVLIRQQTP
jgi:hypothetical protein